MQNAPSCCEEMKDSRRFKTAAFGNDGRVLCLTYTVKVDLRCERVITPMICKSENNITLDLL
jgi:hypothetical protein